MSLHNILRSPEHLSCVLLVLHAKIPCHPTFGACFLLTDGFLLLSSLFVCLFVWSCAVFWLLIVLGPVLYVLLGYWCNPWHLSKRILYKNNWVALFEDKVRECRWSNGYMCFTFSDFETRTFLFNWAPYHGRPPLSKILTLLIKFSVFAQLTF